MTRYHEIGACRLRRCQFTWLVIHQKQWLSRIDPLQPLRQGFAWTTQETLSVPVVPSGDDKPVFDNKVRIPQHGDAAAAHQLDRRFSLPADILMVAEHSKHSETSLQLPKRGCHVLIDKMTPGTMAHIDAAFAGTNNLEVKTGHLEAFTLRLNGHPSFSKNEPLTIRINGLPVRSAPKLNHSFLLKDGKWVAEKAETAVTSKKPGLEGPMARAFTRRIVIVYGTANASGDQEISERRALAVKAADFSVSFGSGFSQPSQINPRVLSDKQVTADDYMFSNFLIFGTKETNEVIAKLADNLPLHLDADAKDYGLVYGYPVNGNLVVIASGIPFWTYKGFSPDQTTGGPRSRIRFATGDGAKALSELKDYLFFDGKNKQVIADGFFDQGWKLGEDDLRKFSQTGVIQINQPR